MQIFPAVKPCWTRRNHRVFGLSHPSWRPTLCYPHWLEASQACHGWEEETFGFFPGNTFKLLNTVFPFDSTSGPKSREQQRFILTQILLCLWTHFSNRVKVPQNTAKTHNSWILNWPHGKATSRRALSQWFWWEGRVDSCSPKSSLFPQSLGPLWERTAPAHRSQPMEEEKNWNHGKSGNVFMTIIWKQTQKGQKESAKERSHSPLCEIVSHGIPKHKRKRLKKKKIMILFSFSSTQVKECVAGPQLQGWSQ